MHDQPIQGCRVLGNCSRTLAEEDAQIAGAVLGLLLAEHPDRFTIGELLRAMSDGEEDGAVKQVVRDLVGAGLLRLNCDEIVPTRAALYFDRLDRI